MYHRYNTVSYNLGYVWARTPYIDVFDAPICALQYRPAPPCFTLSLSETSHSTHQPRTVLGFPQTKELTSLFLLLPPGAVREQNTEREGIIHYCMLILHKLTTIVRATVIPARTENRMTNLCFFLTSCIVVCQVQNL